MRRAAVALAALLTLLAMARAAALDRLRVENTGDSVAFSVLDIGEQAASGGRRASSSKR